MSRQDAAFARIIHERVLNALQVIALGQTPPGLVAGILEWIDDPSTGHAGANPDGLIELVERAVRRSGVGGVAVAIAPDLQIRCVAVGAALVDAIVEALRNADRHAAASRVEVRTERIDGRLRVVIADDGIGFAQGSAARLGLSVGIHEAMAGVGGRAEVLSAAGRGTTVLLWLPHHESDRAGGAEGVEGGLEVGLEEQWPEVAAGARTLLARLASGEIVAAAPEVVEGARIEAGRIRTWLDCQRVDSWMVREVWRCVSRAADDGRYLRAAISGEGGIGEPPEVDFMPILKNARSVTVTLGVDCEELLALVDSSEVVNWKPDPRVQVQTVSELDGVLLVRMRRER